MAGDLLLEWASFGSVTAEYRRLWFVADGTFRLNIVDWMQQTGEKCRQSFTGTWTFKEGYTTDHNGGGVVVKIGITSSAGSGDEVLAFANAEPGYVYVGPQAPVQYERNPQIIQNCPEPAIECAAPLGRVAQWESARFTRERSQVRNPPRPLPGRPATAGLLRSRAVPWLACWAAYGNAMETLVLRAVAVPW